MAGGSGDQEAERLKAQGNEKLKAGNAKEALALYEKALARLPAKVTVTSPLATLSASLCLNSTLASLQLENWEAAERFASRALRSYESSKGYFRRGLARAQMKGLEADAKRDFEMALKLEPKGSPAAQLVQTELAKLTQSEATGYEAPPTADPRAAKRFQIANANKQQQGLREVTFSEWQAMEQKVAAANASASAWRKRLEEASTCPRPEQGAADVTFSKLLDGLVSKAAKQRPSAGELVPVAPTTTALVEMKSEDVHSLRGEPGSVQFLVPGPWLFNGKTFIDLPYDVLANPQGNFTVEMWAACSGVVGHQCLLDTRDSGAGKVGYMFYVEPDGLWSFWVGTGKSWEKLYGSKVTLGKWTHLRGTVDVKNKEARFYVDHQLVARGWVSFVGNTRQVLRLGAGKPEGEAKFFFTGDLRDVAVIGRLVEEDLSAEMMKLAQSTKANNTSLEQLPQLLRQNKGSCLSTASCALGVALKWTTGMLVPGSSNAEDFRRDTLRLLESSATAQGMRLLFLSFNIGGVLHAEGDELHLTFGGGTGQQYWAVILQSGNGFKILYDVESLSTLSEALTRQKTLRKDADGWLLRKDVAMWLGALDTLAFGLSEEDLEDALLTVFLFGFWASKTLTPQVRLKRFEGNRNSKVQAALLEDVPVEVLGGVLQSLTEEAQK